MAKSFSKDEMIMYKEKDKIMTGGYTIDSLFLQSNVNPLTSINHLQTGGKGSKSKNLNQETNTLSQIFNNFAVPAGLLLFQPTNKPKFNTNTETSIKPVDDNLYEKLLTQVDKKKRPKFANATNRRKKKKNVTRKQKL
tara:strand:- start:242 stop:655 length:414 start_codon:yes stop_codon:yes gene_type:complete